MKANAEICFKLNTAREASTLFKALAPETKVVKARAKATLSEEGNHLVLRVEARDTVALRSALNSYLRWAESVVGIIQAL